MKVADKRSRFFPFFFFQTYELMNSVFLRVGWEHRDLCLDDSGWSDGLCESCSVGVNSGSLRSPRPSRAVDPEPASKIHSHLAHVRVHARTRPPSDAWMCFIECYEMWECVCRVWSWKDFTNLSSYIFSWGKMVRRMCCSYR